ncbi:hypothetical protein ACHWQZ_G011616 [Mnemiopsis leidyi]
MMLVFVSLFVCMCIMSDSLTSGAAVDMSLQKRSISGKADEQELEVGLLKRKGELRIPGRMRPRHKRQQAYFYDKEES